MLETSQTSTVVLILKQNDLQCHLSFLRPLKKKKQTNKKNCIRSLSLRIEQALCEANPELSCLVL